MMNLKLGLLPAQPASKRPLLASYRTTYLPAHPMDCDWTAGRQDWGMMLNDQIGDCGLAGPLHQVMAWTQAVEPLTAASFTDAQIEEQYTALTGYDPRTGENDSGLMLGDVCSAWQRQGLLGHRIEGWVSGQVHHLDELLFGSHAFGGALLGLELPLSARDQLAAGQPWSLRGRWGYRNYPGSWGRHCVLLLKYDTELAWVITWGKVQEVTVQWLDYYLDEVVYPVSRDFLNREGRAPNGLDLTGLLKDLRLLGPVL